MTINIFGLAEGLRATDLTAAKPTKAITAAGPAVLKNITTINASMDIIFLRLLPRLRLLAMASLPATQ